MSDTVQPEIGDGWLNRMDDPARDGRNLFAYIVTINNY